MSRTNKAQEAKDLRNVRIVVREQSVVLPADVADIVEQTLSPRSLSSQHPEGNVRFSRRDKRGRLRIRPRLLPRVEQHLEDLGCHVRVIDKRFLPWFPSASETTLQSAGTDYLRGIQQAVSDSLAENQLPGGAIAIRRLSDTPEVIAAIAGLFPFERVLVVVKNRDLADRVASRLRSLVDLPVTTNSDFEWDDGPQIHVDNMQSLTGRNVEDWRIVIVADVESATAKTVIDHVNCMDLSSVFAIVPTSHKFDTEDQLRLESLCGPVIYRERDDSSLFTHVEVFWLAPRAYPADQPANPLERKCLYFRHNARRNQQIAEGAHALRTIDEATLRRLRLDQSRVVKAAAQSGEPPRVCILVETPDHGRELGKLLRPWKQLGNCGREQDDLDLPLMLDQAIVTIPRAYEQGLAFDVVIRASGTEQTWKPAYGPHAALNGSEMLIVDIMDDVDERARLDWRRRRQDYEQQDWHISTITS